MRDYLSPAKRYVSRAMAHPSALRAFVIQKRALVFAITASFVVIMTLGFATVRGFISPNTVHQNTVTKETSAPNSESITTVTNSEQSLAPTEEPQSTGTTTPSSTSESKTSVTVNDQPIDVPANGSVHKTITNENGTTQVDISSSSTSSNNSEPSSVSSTNLNVNTNSYLQNMGIDSQ